mmetsp:Transcript_33605/g.73539  ORF Transcript_33605/g.73539 Transcript_33605/m.73539 type:complete len:98 (-) Transcript_33605:3-296(-)
MPRVQDLWLLRAPGRRQPEAVQRGEPRRVVLEPGGQQPKGEQKLEPAAPQAQEAATAEAHVASLPDAASLALAPLYSLQVPTAALSQRDAYQGAAPP